MAKIIKLENLDDEQELYMMLKNGLKKFEGLKSSEEVKLKIKKEINDIVHRFFGERDEV